MRFMRNTTTLIIYCVGPKHWSARLERASDPPRIAIPPRPIRKRVRARVRTR